MTYFIGKQPTVGNFIKLDALTASATASYTMQYGGSNYSPESVNQMLVSLNGVIQEPTTSYTISGSTLTFASALTSSDSIDFIMVYGDVLNIGTPSDNTVSTAKIQADAINATKIADDSISDEHLDITAITGQTAITSLADTDKFLVSDASDSGNLKYVEKQYLPSGTLVKVGDVRSNSSSASHSLTGIFSDTYDKYFFSLSTFPVTAGHDVYMQFLDSSDTAITTGYYGASYGRDQSGNTESSFNNGTTAVVLNNGHSNGRAFQAQGYIVGPTSGIANNKQVMWQASQWDDVNVFEIQNGGYANVSATDYTGIKVLSGVNLTAISLQVYGIVDTKHYNGS